MALEKRLAECFGTLEPGSRRAGAEAGKTGVGKAVANASHQRLFEDPARPMGIRDFRSGDTIRQINWKASAHTRQLMVKTFEPAISLETAVLLNLHAPDYTFGNLQDTTEWAIEVAASLAAHLVNQRQSVGLITNGIDPLASQQRGFDETTGRLLRPSQAEIQSRPEAFIPAAIPPAIVNIVSISI